MFTKYLLFVFVFSFYFFPTVDIDTVETTTQLPAISDMAALGNSSNRSDFQRLQFASILLNLPILLVVVLNILRSYWML